MSLILEALKKLEREKQVPERGFLVMAAAPWPSSTRRGAPAVVLGILAAMAVGGGIVYWLLRPAPTTVAPLPSTTAVTSAPRPASERPSPSAGAVDVPSVAPARSPASAAKNPDVRPAAPALAPPRAPTPTAQANASGIASLTPPFTLEAISFRDGAPIAIINGRLLHEGDVTNGITVLKIGTESVELEVAGVRQMVRF